MNQMSPTPQVLCRPAIEADQADVTEFCKGIWEGEDYVPQVWERWFHDPDGLLAVAEFEGHAIGCSKISRLSKGQWWLEGFRVDPQYQGMKVGSHLHQYVTGWWLENGDGTLRLMTDGQNFVMHHLCAKTGYIKAGEVCGYRATSIWKLQRILPWQANPLQQPVVLSTSAGVSASPVKSLSITIRNKMRIISTCFTGGGIGRDCSAPGKTK